MSLSDATGTTADGAGSYHKSRSQSYESENLPIGNESLLKVIKVSCLPSVQLTLILIIYHGYYYDLWCRFFLHLIIRQSSVGHMLFYYKQTLKGELSVHFGSCYSLVLACITLLVMVWSDHH